MRYGPGWMVSPGNGLRVQHEAIAVLVEMRVVRQQMAGELPELRVEAVEDVMALDAHLLDDFLVKIVQELLARVALAGGDFCSPAHAGAGQTRTGSAPACGTADK